MTNDRCQCWNPTRLPHQPDCPERRIQEEQAGVYRPSEEARRILDDIEAGLRARVARPEELDCG